MGHANTCRMAEIDRAPGIAIDRDIAQLRNLAPGENLPMLAQVVHSQQAVAGSYKHSRWIGRVIIHRVDEGVIEARMPPAAGARFDEYAAGRKSGAHHIVLRSNHAGVETVL